MDKLIEIIQSMTDDKLLQAYNHLLELDQENELVIERVVAFKGEIDSREIQ